MLLYWISSRWHDPRHVACDPQLHHWLYSCNLIVCSFKPMISTKPLHPHLQSVWGEPLRGWTVNLSPQRKLFAYIVRSHFKLFCRRFCLSQTVFAAEMCLLCLPRHIFASLLWQYFFLFCFVTWKKTQDRRVTVGADIAILGSGIVTEYFRINFHVVVSTCIIKIISKM